MWGFHLGRRDPNPTLIGQGRKLDARSLSKTPPSVLPLPLLSWAPSLFPRSEIRLLVAYTPLESQAF
jgi:hypothetical protein